MKACQVKILVSAAEQAGFNGGKPLEGTAAERRIYKAAGRYCIFQAGDQEVIIAFCPIINKGRVLDHPSVVLFRQHFVTV